MRIPITLKGKQYAVKFDGYQFNAIQVNVSKESGQPYDYILGHFKQFGNAIERIIKTSLAESDETVTIREFVERYEQCLKEIRELSESEF